MSTVQSSRSKALCLGLPRVYPITDTRISGLSHLEQVKLLVAGGATFIQLREKHASPRAFCEQAADCVAFTRPLGVKIIVNDRVDIALIADADGVHVGQDDISPTAIRHIVGSGKIIGYSTHTVTQAIAAAGSGVDYIAIGPVFKTRTKADPDPVLGLEGVSAVRDAIGDVPLVAIGGIDPTNIGNVLRAGADSAAIISGILAHQQNLSDVLRRLLHAVG